MQIIFEKQPLFEAVQRVQNAVDKKNTIPVLSNLLLEILDGDARLTGTNLELGISTRVPIQQVLDAGVGSTTFPAQKMFEILRELPEDPVTISVDESYWIAITCGNSSFKIAGLSKEEFPDIHQEEAPWGTFTLANETLRTAIEQTVYAVSRDESRYALTGVLWKCDAIDQKLVLASTDGHRLAVKAMAHDVTTAGEKIVPLKAVNELKKLCTQDVTIAFSANRMMVQSGDTMLYSRLIDAQFPDYAAVIPKDTTRANTLRDRVQREIYAGCLERLRRISHIPCQRSVIADCGNM